MGAVDRKPTLSPSKLTTYLACPSQYRWSYVDPRGRWYVRSKHYYSFGTSLHRVLERFHDAKDAGVQTVDQAVAALEESWIEAGYSSQQEMEEALGEGKSIIVEYAEQERERLKREPVTAQTLCVERRMTVDMGQFNLVGRIDRIDERPDGTLEIIDYKSGYREFTPEDVLNDTAMGCYQLLVKDHFPDRRVVATLVSLRTNTRATAALPEAELDLFRGAVKDLGNEILCREWEMLTPAPIKLCSGCDFVPLCRKHPRYLVATE
jgi:RecB family exonuclease